MNRFLTTWNYMKGLPKQLFFDKAKLNSRHFSPQNEPPCQAMNRFLKSIRWNYVRGLPIQSIFNQEKLNSCSIVAATECAYYAYIRENGRANLPAPFSVQQVLERLDSVTWRPRRRTKTGRKYGYGADPCDIFQYLKVYGVVDSIYYPYKGTSMSRSDVASYKSERRYYIRDYQELTNSNIDLRTVLKSSLIWVGFPVGKSFINYQTGIYRGMTQKEKQHLQKTKRSKRPMRHSIVIIGWGIENNEVVYLAKNSWGEKWGMKGLLKISESAIRQGCIYTCSGGYFKDIIKTNKKNQGVGASLSSTTRGTTGARRSGNVFVKLDITSSQLLVTENDVKTPEFRSLLSQTVNSLLALRSIPIFNENDAISTRRAPYEDSSGIFWDSDSLAALLALELKEDILVLLSEVEGLFSGPPSDPTSKLIHMYVKQKHHGAITFGNKSRVGRGGMTAKVKAAIGCAESGTPVIIASGFVARNIAKVLEGQRIGTLFHRDAHTWTTLDELGAHEIAVAARDCSMALQVITSAIPQTVGEKLIGLVTSKEDIPDLLKLDDVIDLVIPRGSNRLVSQIKSSTKIVVLGHSDGICHVYVDKSANMKLARRVVVDSKLNYPAACNAMETILVHQDLSGSEGLQDLLLELSHGGVTLYGGPRSSTLLNLSEAKSFHHEYNSRACTIEIVNDVKAAVDHIRRYGSGHIECIVAENKETAEYFLHQVDSAAVFHNASTRFCDGMRFGLGAEVGISTSKIHARGPVGLEGLLTTKWVLRGNGHVVQKDDGVIYTHKNLSVSSLDELEPDLATTGMLLEMDNSELLHRSVGFTRGPSSQGARRC